jgi:hypothetical protein
VYAALRKEARAGRISSKTLAEMQVSRPRKDRLDAASRDMIGWDIGKEMDKRRAQREREERRKNQKRKK